MLRFHFAVQNFVRDIQDLDKLACPLAHPILACEDVLHFQLDVVESIVLLQPFNEDHFENVFAKKFSRFVHKFPQRIDLVLQLLFSFGTFFIVCVLEELKHFRIEYLNLFRAIGCPAHEVLEQVIGIIEFVVLDDHNAEVNVLV